MFELSPRNNGAKDTVWPKNLMLASHAERRGERAGGRARRGPGDT